MHYGGAVNKRGLSMEIAIISSVIVSSLDNRGKVWIDWDVVPIEMSRSLTKQQILNFKRAVETSQFEAGRKQILSQIFFFLKSFELLFSLSTTTYANRSNLWYAEMMKHKIHFHFFESPELILSETREIHTRDLIAYSIRRRFNIMWNSCLRPNVSNAGVAQQHHWTTFLRIVCCGWHETLAGINVPWLIVDMDGPIWLLSIFYDFRAAILIWK